MESQFHVFLLRLHAHLAKCLNNRFFREGSFTTLVLTHLEPVVGPRSKLEVAALVIKWEPGDVNFARGLEDARRHIEHGALRRGHNVCLESPIKPLVGTE